MNPEPNVRQVVPFFNVTDILASTRFYIGGLGFQQTHRWEVAGRLRWCWLQLGGAALMLQEYASEGEGARRPTGKLGEGVALSFQCADALSIYTAAKAQGLTASRPFVGNHMWVTTLFDPDGYRLEFESPTDQPEGTEYTESHL